VSLADIMGHSDLSMYPQIALLIFLAVFGAKSARVLLSRRHKAEYQRAATLPLEEGARLCAFTSHVTPRDEHS
jgi:hypothetical protein